MSREPTLVLFSGLGGDGRLFRPQMSLPGTIVAPEWIDPRPGDTLVSYARRFAEHLDLAPPYILGGVSMGAMLALEMSRTTRPEAVLLIAAGRSSRALSPLWRSVARALGAIPFWGSMPPRLSQPLATLIAKYLLPSVRQLSEELRTTCAEMGRASSPPFVRWGLTAVTTWPGVDLPRVPVYHIHGEKDRVFPLRRVQPDYVVRGGGHLINMTHADEVNAYLIDRIETHKRNGDS